MKVFFDAEIPTSTTRRRQDTQEQQVEELVKDGKAFSAREIFQNGGKMCITDEAVC